METGSQPYLWVRVAKPSKMKNVTPNIVPATCEVDICKTFVFKQLEGYSESLNAYIAASLL